MAYKIPQISFGGGEVSPEMYGRIDDARYRAGLAKCRNFVIKPQGPAENRPGFAYVCEVKDSSKAVRLIPFTFSSTQTMVIEMGEGYFRFHTNGATIMDDDGITPLELASPYAEKDLFDIHYVQSADVLTLAHQEYAPSELRRLGATQWELKEINFNPSIQPPQNVLAVETGSTEDKYTYYYVVTALDTYGTGESKQSVEASVEGNLFETGATVTVSWDAVSGATSYNVYKLQGGIYGYIGQTNGNSIVDDNIAPDMSKTPPIYDPTFAAGGIESVPVLDGGSGYGTEIKGGGITKITMTNKGNNYRSPVLTVSDPTGTGATFQATSSGFGSPIFSVKVLTPGSGYTNPTFTFSDAVGSGSGASCIAYIEDIPTNTPALEVTDTTGSGALLVPIINSSNEVVGVNVVNPGQDYSSPVITWSNAAGGSGAVFGDAVLGGDDYPGAVSYFEQRRCFAGSANKPQNIWMTKSGTEANMSYSLPVRDDDRISFRVAAREANTIRHIVPMTQLLLLTSSAEWRVGSVNSDAITPSTISVSPQSYVGASNVQPSIINNTLIYGAARGGHVRELAYNWQANGFVTGDLSLRSSHLFDNYEILDMAYAKAPQPIMWFVSSSGKLLGLTYVPEQQVGAWHQHDTDGIFESCAAVAEGGEDVLYCVIRREINGQSVRYIERLHSRLFTDKQDAFFVDCGSTYSGPPSDVISGLDYIEGKTVNILADGAVHPQRVVTGGSITLDVEASIVHIGLPIESDFKTLPLTVQLQDGSFGQGHIKNINKVWLRVINSSGVFAGPDENSLTEYKQRTNEPWGSPPALKSAEVSITLSPSWNEGGQIMIRQSDPLPLTVVSLTAEVTMG